MDLTVVLGKTVGGLWNSGLEKSLSVVSSSSLFCRRLEDNAENRQMTEVCLVNFRGKAS